MEVNFYDVCCYVMKKWRSILCFALILGIFLCGIKYFADFVALKNASNEERELTDGEMAQIENVKVLQDAYTAAQNYVDNSIKMSINPYDKYFMTKHYVIRNSSFTEVEINNLTKIIADYLKGSTCGENIEKILETDRQFIQEVIEIETKQNSGIVNISVIGNDEDFCKMVSNVIDDEVVNCVNDLKLLGYEFEILLVESNAGSEVDINLYTLQSTIKSQVNAMNVNFTTELQKLTMEQQDYLKEINGEQLQENEDNQSGPRISIKVGIVGMFLGGVLAILFYGIRYLSKNSVQNQKQNKCLSEKKEIK